MKVFLDRPAVRNDLQNHCHIHRRVGADVGRPVPAGMFQQDHAHGASGHMTGRKKCLVATFDHDATTRIADRLPSLSILSSIDQADSVLSILTRTPPLTRLVHRKIEQFGITAKPGYHRRPFGQEPTHQHFARVRAVKHHDESSPAAERFERSYHLAAEVQRELMFGAEFPLVSGLESFDVHFPNVQMRQQRQGNHAEQWMRKRERQADPVVTVEPLAVARTGRGVVVNVGRFDTGPESFRWRIVDQQRPIALFAGVELLEDEHQQRQHQRSGVFADRLQQSIEPIPVVFDARTAKPTCCGSAASREQRTGHHDWKSKPGAGVEQPAHRHGQSGNASGQRHKRLARPTSTIVAFGQPNSLIMLGRFGFRSMLSLWRSAAGFTLSHPWPRGEWDCVRTTIFHAGLFRGYINSTVTSVRLKCSKEELSEKVLKSNSTLQDRASTEVVRITLSNGADRHLSPKPHNRESETDAQQAARVNSDKIVVDLYCGEDVLPQMNTHGTNKDRHTKMSMALNALDGVTINLRTNGPGNEISEAIVRCPIGYKESEAKIKVVAAIESILRTAGIPRTQVVVNRANRRVPSADSRASVDEQIVTSGHVVNMAGNVIPKADQPAVEDRAWQKTDPYVPPNFNRHFADSMEGGFALDALWDAPNKDSRSDAEILNTVRQGFRNTRQHRMPILRWIGNKYIWNKSSQNPDAIELMYHAADFSGENANPSGARHSAVYFGLSVTQPKTPAILRTLAELAVQVDDPNDLGRIAWGASNQKAELLKYLKPFQDSNDEAVRNKAEVCRKIFNGELKAFAWAAEQAQQRAQEEYADQLPQFRRTLMSGSSEERLNLLQTILGKRIALIMDDSFVEAFAKCAEDESPKVRVQTTIIAGARWVWEVTEKQHPEAIQLMLKLSQDDHHEVRYNAVYYGLSTVRQKSDEVIRRLLEMAFADREPNLFHRIEWALRNHRERVTELLDEYIDGENAAHAEAARELFEQFTGQDVRTRRGG